MKPGGARGGRPRLGGHGTLPTTRPAAQASEAAQTPGQKRVLFVCIGNSCRSQMAEAFARTYGRDVMEAASAGLSPAAVIAPMTEVVLNERNVSVEGQFPKAFETMARQPFDIVVNMSGVRIALEGTRVIDWPVVDPMGQSSEIYRSVAAQIETLVMRLILELRAA